MTPAPPSHAELTRLRALVATEVVAALGRATELGFLGGMELTDQIDHALGFVMAVERRWPEGPPSVLDLGTGGGVPGLVLGSCWPGRRVVLVDAGQRRTEFLTREVAHIPRLSAVEVVRARTEELGRDPHYRDSFEVVTARSFGSPGTTAECGSAFLAPGGLMVVSEPPTDAGDQRWPPEGLIHLALEAAGRVRFDQRFGYQLLAKLSPTPERYPRRTGAPAKRPLF
jgi:16S rRNA (guanine527-N7)-methyltransferase